MIKELPRDCNEHIIQSVSGATTVFNGEVTNGGFQPIILPDGVDSKSVSIQIHNGSATDFSSFQTNPPGFHFAKTASPGTAFAQCRGTLSFRCVSHGGTTIGYIRAAASQVVSVTVFS